MSNGKNLTDPKVGCSHGTGSLLAEVMTYRHGAAKPKKTALANVDVAINGPTQKPPQKTAGNGRTSTFSGLTPSSYTVTVSGAGTMKDTYDFDTGMTSSTKEVKKGKTQTYYFEVPWFWLEHEVKYPDGKTFAENVDWVLYHKSPTGQSDFRQHSMGTTAGSTISLDKIPQGQYKLLLKLVYDPSADAEQAVIGTPITLKAKVSGFDPGTAGTIDICDAHAPGTVLKTLNGTVAQNAAGIPELSVSWTPAKTDLTNLKSGKIVFRPTVQGKSVLGGPLPMCNKETYQVVDDAGNNLTTAITIRFSGGHIVNERAVNGTVDIVYPWNETVSRMNFPGQDGARISLDEGGVPTRSFSTPF